MRKESFFSTTPTTVYSTKTGQTFNGKEITFNTENKETFFKLDDHQMKMQPLEPNTYYKVNESDSSILLATHENEGYRLAFDDRTQFENARKWLQTNVQASLS